MVSDDEIIVQVLRKMIYHGFIGGKHTSEDNVCKGFPSHAKKRIKKIMKNLYNNGFILVKPTGYGRQISLNPRRLKEVREVIQR